MELLGAIVSVMATEENLFFKANYFIFKMFLLNLRKIVLNYRPIYVFFLFVSRRLKNICRRRSGLKKRQKKPKKRPKKDQKKPISERVLAFSSSSSIPGLASSKGIQGALRQSVHCHRRERPRLSRKEIFFSPFFV